MWTFLIIWNIAVFLLYGVDKWRARKGYWRIQESVLIGAAWLLGGLGALLGMVAFHHKTGKMKFRILIPLAIIENLVLIYFAGLLR